VKSLAKLVWYLRREGVKHIIVYSGYTWETLLNPLTGVLTWVKTIMENIDVVVDGQFVKELDDPFITYRGSRNQRPIDVASSLCENKVITLNWDHPEVVITTNGDALMPIGLAVEIESVGTVNDTRMCGQTKTVKKG